MRGNALKHRVQSYDPINGVKCRVALLNFQAPQEILVLQQLIETKENSENITFDETTSKAFDVLKTVSSTQSCRFDYLFFKGDYPRT